jgi:hypothetical protein
MKRVIVGFLVISFSLLIKSCDTTDPPDNKSLTLKLEDVSCTEAWITFTTTSLQLPTTVTLKQTNPTGETKSQILNLNTQDSLLYIDSLLPNQTYSFQSTIQSSNQSSNELSVTTMDTTSHNFTFETLTFGDIGNNVLFDVAIVGNEIWAVGEIRIADTSVIGYTMYNAVHWDGSEWTLHRIMFYTICGQPQQNAYPASSVFAISVNEIFIAGGGNQIAKLENGIQTQTSCLNWSFSINELCGTDIENLYAVGTNGTIVHYRNGNWSRLTSGTGLGLTDITENENGDIYACGGNLSTGQGIVLKINSNNTVTKIIDSYYYGSGFDSTKMFTENLYGPLVGIWVAENGSIYTVGNIIYRYINGRWDYAKGIEYNYLGAGEFTGRGFSWDVSGNKNNDFVFVGERNTVRYFNGIRAVQIGEPFSYTSEYQWYSVDYKQNTAVTAGKKGGYAAVIIFKR